MNLEERYGELYNLAGEEVEDPSMSISLSSHKHLLSDNVHDAMMEVLRECNLGFELQDFQKVALHVIGSSRNLVLIAPTGSGKMLVIYLGVLLLRKVMKNPLGVAVGTQPLSIILEEKLDSGGSGPFDVGVIRMDGSLISGEDDDNMKIKLSHQLSKFTSGELPYLMGHAESWNTPTGKAIIKVLKEKGLFLLFFVDEFHQGLTDHWAEIRPEMRNVPSCLQIHKNKGAPSVVMSATATEAEVMSMKRDFGLRDPVILKENPVQSHYNFQIVERPPSLYQTSGKFDSSGEFHPGVEALLNILYLNRFVANPLTAKKAMIFFRTENYLLDINDSLCDRLPNYSDPFTQPWIQCHGGTGEITEALNYNRRNEITLFLTTTKMLMGIDLKGIEIIIFVRPLNMLHYILQGAGRGGRKNKSCKRKKVLVYILYNKSDIAGNVPGMSQEVKDFLVTSECLKSELSSFFGFFYTPRPENNAWCCSNCS